jgi:hypothetical protein
MIRKISLTLVIFLSLIIFSGCQFYTPSLSKLNLGTKVDNETKEVIDPTAGFEKSTPIIYASVLIKNAPPGTLLKAYWEREGRPVIDPIELEAEGSRYAAFTLKKPPEGFRSGNYKIRIEIDKTNIVLEKEFTIQ